MEGVEQAYEDTLRPRSSMVREEDSGGSVCESNTPSTPRRCRAPVLKTGRITGSHSLPHCKINNLELCSTKATAHSLHKCHAAPQSR